jgi:hypothetical protein
MMIIQKIQEGDIKTPVVKDYIEYTYFCTGFTLCEVPEKIRGWKIIVDSFPSGYIQNDSSKDEPLQIAQGLELCTHTFKFEEP